MNTLYEKYRPSHHTTTPELHHKRPALYYHKKFMLRARELLKYLRNILCFYCREGEKIKGELEEILNTTHYYDPLFWRLFNFTIPDIKYNLGLGGLVAAGRFDKLFSMIGSLKYFYVKHRREIDFKAEIKDDPMGVISARYVSSWWGISDDIYKYVLYEIASYDIKITEHTRAGDIDSIREKYLLPMSAELFGKFDKVQEREKAFSAYGLLDSYNVPKGDPLYNYKNLCTLYNCLANYKSAAINGAKKRNFGCYEV